MTKIAFCDICENLMEDSVTKERSELNRLPELNDFVGVHLSIMTTNDARAPALPSRARADARREGVRRARAPSPAADVTEEKGESSDHFTSPPPIPPRLPPRVNHTLKHNQKYPERLVHDPGLSEVLLLSTPIGLHLPGAELLQSRPPPPLPPRDEVINDVSAELTLQPITRSPWKSNRLASSRDADRVWWPSREQQSAQLHQLTHWPISALSPIMSTEEEQQPSTGSRKMNDYIDSPIALHSNARIAVNGLEMMENSINSEASDTSFDHHLWPTPLVLTSVPSPPKIKSGSECRIETTTECQQRIICTRCGKCRCKQCTVARPLPSCGARECSAQSAIDCCTCMCCARAVFYHCRTTEDNDYSGDPCACTEQGDCCKRWTLLALLSFCLPCLCLYCPLSGALRLCTACYNQRHSRDCCCCEDERLCTEASKGLLIESESSSS